MDPRLGGAAGLALASLAFVGQTPPPVQAPVFKTGIRTVVVPVTVTDGDGRFVRDLTREDFEVRDNGRPQAITLFEKDVTPVTAVLMIDASASMLRSLRPVIGSVNEFILRMLPGDRARVGSFAEDIRISKTFTGDRDALLDIFENEFEVRIGRRTRLWDAMHEAVAALAGETGRRVVIVITDGVDTWSIRQLADVSSVARRHEVAVYAIRFRPMSNHGQQIELTKGPDGSSPGRVARDASVAFENLARDTGGGFMEIHEGWPAPFTDISLDLHSQYVLGFTIDGLDGKEHGLDVSAKRPGLKTRARRSYLATEDGTRVDTRRGGA